MHLSAPTVDLRLLVFREGLLSAVGHDLELRATRVEVDWDPDAGTVRAEIDPDGLEVLHALSHGRPEPKLLSAHERETIQKNLRHDVLETRRHPRIHFEGRAGEDLVLEGTLELHGVKRPLRLAFERTDAYDEAALSLDQRDFGIRPYSALLGSLKVKPEVQLRVRVRLRA